MTRRADLWPWRPAAAAQPSGIPGLSNAVALAQRWQSQGPQEGFQMAYKQSLVAAVLIAMTAACGGGDPQIPADAQEMGLVPVGSAQQYNSSGYTDRTRLVIRDQDAWASAWTTVMAYSAS